MHEQHNRILLHKDFGQHRTICGDLSLDEHLYRHIIHPNANATNMPTTVGHIISLLSS
jgi:hypothetical protein